MSPGVADSAAATALVVPVAVRHALGRTLEQAPDHGALMPAGRAARLHAACAALLRLFPPDLVLEPERELLLELPPQQLPPGSARRYSWDYGCPTDVKAEQGSAVHSAAARPAEASHMQPQQGADVPTVPTQAELRMEHTGAFPYNP